MGRLLYALAIVTLGVSAAVIVVTSAALPASVASHFGAQGYASGYMPRDDYRLLMLGLAVLLPLGIVLSLALLPRVSPSLVNVPNIRAWLVPPHRADTLATLGARGALFAIMLSAFICATHLLVVRANAQLPPRLDAGALGSILGVFMLGVALWVIALLLHFRRPPA
ncbi:MAG: hypothetical protein ABI294_01380 [Casimicrobiaceae bacterium]